ncbi:MAG: hypothetical protein OEN56_15810, partial [Gemmatimonadota bacterium]|nr:hypothetical protein [Gemmatimonadota bacterium]
MSQLGDPASPDLCGGFSPCDAYDYRGDGSIGAPGMCFLPPTVDNHLSDPACSGDFTPGLSGIFQLAWCRVEYADSTGATPPDIVTGTCQDPSDWQDLVEDNGHYSASVRWRRNEASDGDIFRVYVVRGEQAFAHRDLIIDPNLTTPADEYVHAIGYGNEPIKLRISDDFSCIKFDTQGGAAENAATCLISGATTVSFDTEEMITTFNFPDGNPTFLADFEVSECLSLGFNVGGIGEFALVDVPLADCKVTLSSEEVETLIVPGEIRVTISDARWDAEFLDARLNVLQYDEFGVGALPPSTDPGWFGLATSGVAALRWLDWGLDKLASLILPEPLYAEFTGGWDFTRMSDFQVALMPVMDHASSGTACASAADYCLDLGTFSGEAPVVPVSVRASAPWSQGSTSYPDNHFDVPDTRLHFFPASGTVSCPGAPMAMTETRGCVPANSPDYSTDPASYWGDHVVVVTGDDGTGSVDWSLAGGENVLHVSACGVARPGDSEADSPDGGVWGDLGDCSDREVALTAAGHDNGPADGFTPFEPVDIDNEVAIYGLPLEFVARTCPTITVDGIKADASGTAEWEACATQTVFTAPQKGPKVSDNATLYTYSDGEALYIGVEVATSELGNKIFVNLTEGVATIGGVEDGVEAAGDEVLVIDQLGIVDGGSFGDWHYT